MLPWRRPSRTFIQPKNQARNSYRCGLKSIQYFVVVRRAIDSSILFGHDGTRRFSEVGEKIESSLKSVLSTIKYQEKTNPLTSCPEIIVGHAQNHQTINQHQSTTNLVTFHDRRTPTSTFFPTLHSQQSCSSYHTAVERPLAAWQFLSNNREKPEFG